MKNVRQKKILELVNAYDIDTQEALLAKLEEVGIYATQTTISRDINQLKLLKATNPKGGYKYVSPSFSSEGASAPVMNSALRDAVLKIEAAKNIVVIKTYPGMANALAVCVDSLYHNEIVGSVAGDDTILLVIKDDEEAKRMEEKIKSTFAIGV